ncbi:MAG: pyridoxal 5'-phosphate synthase glutaminase subunit PdxT [Acidimicrobiales bacterium]
MTIGVLDLQGDAQHHATVLESLGEVVRPVRGPRDLDGLAGVVLPGGESTTLSLLLESADLFAPLAEALAGGLPVLGTCAGMILLARDVLDGRSDQRTFGAIDLTVRRNGHGRQIASFECDLDLPIAGAGPFHAVFIRAPVVERVGPDVEVLAALPGGTGPLRPEPVACRQGRVLVTSFHPELTEDRRLHEVFAGMVRGDLTMAAM